VIATSRNLQSVHEVVDQLNPLQSKTLTALGGIRHGMTGRVPGIEPAEANISYSAPRDQHAAWAMRQAWCSKIGVDPESLAVPRQVHGNKVAIATSRDAGAGAAPGSTLLADADAIVTDDPGVTLMTTHADCLPVLMYDPSRMVIAAVHAGWRGTVSNIAGETVSLMQSELGVHPRDVHAFIGPAICAACYEVGEEVASAWLALDKRDDAGVLTSGGGLLTLDLVAANEHLLIRTGVPAHQIERSNICTRCHGDRWFSHRGQGPATGRFGAIIALDSDGR
jgi:YfiH family protein